MTRMRVIQECLGGGEGEEEEEEEEEEGEEEEGLGGDMRGGVARA